MHVFLWNKICESVVSSSSGCDCVSLYVQVANKLIVFHPVNSLIFFILGGLFVF